MMTGTFGRLRREGLNWRRELPPVLAVAGLAADYLSPPALWTMLLPFAAVVLLAGLRRWALAATVFFLSSWVLIPTAARATFALEEMTGAHTAYVIEGVPLKSLERDVVTAIPCVPNRVEFTALPVGPGHLINPRWALRESIVTFAELHNFMVLDHQLDLNPYSCEDLRPADDARE